MTTTTTTATTEKLGNGNLQFQKVNHVLSSPHYPEANNASISPETLANVMNNNHHSDEPLFADIKEFIDSLLASVELNNYPIVTATTSLTSTYDPCTKVSLITPIKIEDDDVTKAKDIVLLRNLEITPPPQELIHKATPSPNSIKEIRNNTAKKCRSSKRTQSEQSDESSASGRSKRQRRQTELFQVDSVRKTATTRKQTRPDTPQIIRQAEQKYPDVIFYERGDHLAIRNEDDTFFLGQLTENVRVEKTFVKIRWLDTDNDGKTYFLTSHYDKIPQKSIIMPVELEKLKTEKKSRQFYTINDQIKNSVLDRLKRSINLQTE